MRRLRRQDGYMLIEASATYVIVTFAIVALLPILALAIKANLASEETVKGAWLAQELLEEVRIHRWDETTPSPRRPAYPAYTAGAALGVDAGESSADKTTFNDVDDFNGWTEAKPLNPVGGEMAGLSGFARTVTVQYVDASLAVSASTTSLKLVTVCVSQAKAAQTCLKWLAGNR